MNKTIKEKIIFSNIIVVLASLAIIIMMLITMFIKDSYANTLKEAKDIQIKWIGIETNLYLSMNRWLRGKPYDIVQENIESIDQQIVSLTKKSKSPLIPRSLKEEIKLMNNLWSHSKITFINPILKKMDFVVQKDFLQLESKQKQKSLAINEINYMTNLNLKELIYTNYQEIANPEKSRYMLQGVSLFEAIDLFFSSSESYTKKVEKTIQMSTEYAQIANRISMFLMILLIFLEISMGILLSINNGNRISKPILIAANKLFDFVGESLERRKESRNDDEIALLNNYVDLLLSYYNDLSGTAKKLSIGDASNHINPKSENDVMGNAF